MCLCQGEPLGCSDPIASVWCGSSGRTNASATLPRSLLSRSHSLSTDTHAHLYGTKMQAHNNNNGINQHSAIRLMRERVDS